MGSAGLASGRHGRARRAGHAGPTTTAKTVPGTLDVAGYRSRSTTTGA
jgi:hypothetical protein